MQIFVLNNNTKYTERYGLYDIEEIYLTLEKKTIKKLRYFLERKLQLCMNYISRITGRFCVLQSYYTRPKYILLKLYDCSL